MRTHRERQDALAEAQSRLVDIDARCNSHDVAATLRFILRVLLDTTTDLDRSLGNAAQPLGVAETAAPRTAP